MMSRDYVKEELQKPSAKKKYPLLCRRYQKRSMESRVDAIYACWSNEGDRLLGQNREDIGCVSRPHHGSAGRPKKDAKYKVGQTIGYKLPPATLYIDEDRKCQVAADDRAYLEQLLRGDMKVEELPGSYTYLLPDPPPNQQR